MTFKEELRQQISKIETNYYEYGPDNYDNPKKLEEGRDQAISQILDLVEKRIIKNEEPITQWDAVRGKGVISKDIEAINQLKAHQRKELRGENNNGKQST